MNKPLTVKELTGEKPQPPKPDWARDMLAISPSTISGWQECPRKVAWDKIARIGRPPKPATDKGIAVHWVQEQWLRLKIPQDLSLTVQLCDNTLFKPGPVAAQGMRYLPPHDHLLAVERRIWVRRPLGDEHGWYLHGDTDFSFTNDDGLYGVGDHKSTGDFKWVKTVEELTTDPQANIYGGAAIRERNELHPHAKWDPIEARWIYYHVGLKGAIKQQLKLTPQQVETGLQALDPIADDICKTLNHLRVLTDIPAADRVKSLPPNLEACSNFGGCPYVGNCQIGAKEAFSAALRRWPLGIDRTNKEKKEDTNMAETLAEKIARRNAEKAAAGGTTATPSVPTPTPSAVPPVPVYTKTGPAEYTYSGQPSVGPLNAPPIPSIQSVMSHAPPQVIPTAEAKQAIAEALFPSVNPPPMPPRAAGLAPPMPQRSQAEKEAADAEELKPRKPRAKKAPEPTPTPHNGASDWEMGVPGVPHAEVATEIAIEQAVEAVAHPTDYQLPESTKQKLESDWDFDLPKTLYVDCFPTRGVAHVVTYTELSSMASARAAEANDVAHYRFIQFGAAPGALQVALRTVLEDQPQHRSIFVDSRTQEAMDGMPELERWADVVIRRM